MIQNLIACGRMLLWWRRLRDFRWARALTRAGIRTYEAVNVTDARALQIEGGTLSLAKTERATSLLECYPELQHISKAGGRYVPGSPWDAIEIGGVTLQIFNAQAVCLAAEVFAAHVYAVAETRPIVVLDVGMNIGTTALYFARHPDVRVIGYEPFRQTYNRAISNFAANPDVRGRIEALNVAWGASSGVRKVQYCAESAGDCGFYEIPKALRGNRPVLTEEIRVESSVECLRVARDRYPERDIVLKLDCEGAEHEILSALRDAGALRDVRILMVEWHRRAREDMPDKVRELLTGSNFVVFGDAVPGVECGMMRAVRC